MSHPPLNQLPLFCRNCNASYELIDEEGTCTTCGVGNIYQRFNIPVTLSFDDYSLIEALGKIKDLFKQLGIPLTINEEG